MQCQNCGATNKTDAKFCAGCGTALIQNLPASSIKLVNSSGVQNFVARHNKGLRVFLTVLASGFTLLASCFSDLPNCIYYIAIALIAEIAVFILAANAQWFHVKNHKKGTLYCPKCKKETHYNKYSVCSECQLDLSGGNIVTMITMFIAGVLNFIACILPKEQAWWDENVCWLSEESSILLLIASIVIAVLMILYPIYMYPAILARRTEHVAATAIYVLNFLFGFTIIFWVVLLIWASSGNGNQKTVVVQNASPQKTAQDAFAEIQKLREAGMITDEEFEAKRQEILSRL